jgi:hypothetical protein
LTSEAKAAIQNKSVIRSAEALAEKLILYAGSVPSAAKAGLILWNVTAQLEASPFQTGFTKLNFSASC